MVESESSKIILDKAVEFVKKTLEGSESGHNWYHINRVLQNAKFIASETMKLKDSKIDSTDKDFLLVVELGALFHDISDYKFNNGDEKKGAEITENFLKSINVDEKIISRVVNVIDSVTFKGLKEKTKELTVESQIVQDADRIDALGAIGIARTFAYGGNKGREMYVPDEKPNLNQDWEQYKNNKSCTINHFYEKLFHLKDLLNTEIAKKLAEKRHKYMEEFVERFKKEWDSQDFEI